MYRLILSTLISMILGLVSFDVNAVNTEPILKNQAKKIPTNEWKKNKAMHNPYDNKMKKKGNIPGQDWKKHKSKKAFPGDNWRPKNR